MKRNAIQQFFERLETQFRQIIREAELREDKLPQHTASALANLLTAVVEGKIRQFVRTEFALKPTAYWDEQWLVLQSQLLRTKQNPTN